MCIRDSLDLADTVVQFLELEGIICHHASNGVAGLHLAREEHHQVLILDLNLPRLDGLSLCQRLRRDGDDRPVLMLTARDRLEDKLAGFETGADDYLVKPFELQEVAARLKVLSGRGRRRNRRELQVGDLTYNLDTLNVNRGGEEIYLNPIGLKLLHCLMEASPNVVSRAELEMEVWGEEMPDSDSLRVHIHSLRGAIDKPFGSNMIQTRHGIGYRLVEPDAVSS